MHTPTPLSPEFSASAAAATPVAEPLARASTSARRLLTRQYKEAPPPMGVFAILNLVEDRIYIGASNNVEGAINRARFELKMNGHRNTRLQQDWQRLGPSAFRFDIVDTVKKRDDPAFDAQAELAAMLALWREELGYFGERAYTTAATQGTEAAL